MNLRDLLQSHAREEINAEIIQEEYFDKGTKGLKALVEKDGLKAERFSNYVKKNYDFLVDVTAKTALIRSESLLRISLDEGSCDFIAYLITGKKGNPETYAYGYEHEDQLYAEWKADLEKDIGDVRNRWVWNWGRKREFPPDLGVFIGFRAAESFYNARTDKHKALQEMHDMEDYELFYEKSGYWVPEHFIISN